MWCNIFYSSLSCFCQDNHRKVRVKNSYIMWYCTRICLSGLKTRLPAPSLNINIISWDPSDPMRRPLIYRTVLRNDCVLWWLPLLSVSLGISPAPMYGRHGLKWCVLWHSHRPGSLFLPPPPSVIVKQKCQHFDNIWPHLHIVYLDTRHSLSFQHLNFLSVLGGTRPLQAALSSPPYGILTVFSSLISL